MNKQQQKNLFAGPTEEQYKKIERQNRIEEMYMEFVRKNPNLTLSEYEDKYKSLNITLK